MMTSDPIADMLTRIRNANTAKHDTVDIPASKIKVAIAGILVDEGFIEKYDIIEDGNFKTIRVTLKYDHPRCVILLDETFINKDASDSNFDLRSWNIYCIMFCSICITDSCKHICNWITCHHHDIFPPFGLQLFS